MLKKLAVKILVFLIVLIIINFIVDWIYKNRVMTHSLGYRKEIQFDNFKDTLEYLILGASGMQNAINPDILKKSFNHTLPGENYMQNYYKLRNIVNVQKRKPENILLPVNHAHFSSFFTFRIKDDDYWVRYIDYFELAKREKDFHYIFKWLKGRFYSWVGNYSDFYNVLVKHKHKRTVLINGFKPIYASYSNTPKKRIEILSKERVNRMFVNKHFDPDQLYYFERILEFCQQNDIKVILVSLPVMKVFYDKVQELKHSEDLYGKLYPVIRKYNVVTYYFDYEKLFFGKPEYFFMPDHLNNEGATKFTKILKDTLCD